MPNEPSEFATRIRAGDADALARFFDARRERLRRQIEFRVDPRWRGRMDADDVLQEAYLAAVKRIAHFTGDSDVSLFIWIRMIVRQSLVDAHRRHVAQRRSAEREVGVGGRDGSGSTSFSLAANLVGQFTTPTLAARRVELAERLAAVLDQMDETDREVLALRHFEELSNQEVAAELGIEQKAASIRYVRALKRLKECTQQIPEFSEDYRGGV